MASQLSLTGANKWFLKQSVVAAEGACGLRCFSIEKAFYFTAVLTAEQNLYQAQNNLALATGASRWH